MVMMMMMMMLLARVAGQYAHPSNFRMSVVQSQLDGHRSSFFITNASCASPIERKEKDADDRHDDDGDDDGPAVIKIIM